MTARYTVHPRPFPVDTLATAIGLNPTDPQLTSKLATHLGLDRRWVRRCRRLGLTVTGADHWATLAGLWADSIWPDWSTCDDDPWYSDDPALDDLEPGAPHPTDRMSA